MVRSTWNPGQLPDLSGRTYVVTGGNRGLGYFASEQLAGAGAHVIMTGRSPTRLADARAALYRRNPDADGQVDTLLLDTSNLGSVRAAAASIIAQQHLDGLLLNAGVVHPPKKREMTIDGNEVVLATNVLGHFALAGVLLPVLAAAERGRMVWVGSMSTSMWKYDPVDPQLVDDYSPWRAYVQSKVATTALGLEAHRRLCEADVPVQSVVAHPGYSISGLTESISGVNAPSRFTRFRHNLQVPIAQSKQKGAWALVRALIDPDAAGGAFFGPASVAKGAPRASKPAKVTRSAGIGTRLWQFCENVTGMQWPMYKARRAGEK